MSKLNFEAANTREIGLSGRKPRHKKNTIKVHPNSMAARKWGRKTFATHA